MPRAGRQPARARRRADRAAASRSPRPRSAATSPSSASSRSPRADGHVYVAPEDIALAPPADRPPTSACGGSCRRHPGHASGRSGLILVLTGTPGTASVVAQAIDESTLDEQEGTLAGDNTLLVLFADEPRLERWLDRFRAITALPPIDIPPTQPLLTEVLVKKVVLAYSGGLDTSVAVAWLREQYGVEVVTLTVDLGGGSLREGVEARAMAPARPARTSWMRASAS